MEGDNMSKFDHHHQHGDEQQQEYAYKECLRNHAASIGSYATDGCGEFILDESTPDGGRGSHCAACGCHRNFHRKVPIIQSRAAPHRQDVTITMNRSSSPAKVMHSPNQSNNNSKKRFRTKFTDEQKDKMMIFAEKLGWRIMQQRKDLLEDDDEIERFCKGVGISRKVFKVWMHNHKTNNNSNIISGSNVDLLSN